MTPGYLECLICASSTLITLIIHRGNKVLNALSCRRKPADALSASTCLCPKLEVIKLWRDFLFYLDNALVEMVKSQWKCNLIIRDSSSNLRPPVARLIAVSIIWPLKPDISKRSDIEHLLEFGREGLSVLLQYGPHPCMNLETIDALEI